jgi:hypothetical protein
MQPEYESELETASFKELLNVITMSTEAYFDFKPTIDEIRMAVAEEEGKDIT